MTFDEAIDTLAATDAAPAEAMQWLLDHWDRTAPRCRALLDDYAAGRDDSERTSRALFFVIHLLGERADKECFPALCRLLHDRERAGLVLDDDAFTVSLPCILISTFDGDTDKLHALVEDPDVDELFRGDVLLVLAYAVRTGALPEPAVYDYLNGLPARLLPRETAYVWFAWVRAVAMLGFAGLAGQAEAIMRDGLADAALIQPADFWDALNETRANPGEMASMDWDGVGPMGSATEFLLGGDGATGDDDADLSAPASPVLNPMRNVGRNDPCPCGSGKKYKKCCLPA